MKVIGGVKRRTLSALIYPAVLVALSLVVVAIIVLKVVPEFAAFYDSFGAELPLVTRVIVKVATFIREQILLLSGAAILLGVGGLELGAAGRAAGAAGPVGPAGALGRIDGPPVRDVADGADARDAARRRPAARERHRHRVALDGQPVPLGRDAGRGAARPGGRGVFARRWRRGACSRTSS